jgi:uncharacterized protein (TIRG00374 family)
MTNKKLNAVIIAIVTLIVLVLALKDDFGEKINYIFSFDLKWLFVAFILIFTYWFLKGLVIYFCAKKFKKDYSVKEAIKLILDSQFVNAVTPFSLGCHPYQIYRLKKQGLPLEKGTNVVIQDFIVYQIALILLGTIAIGANYIFGIFPDNLLLKKLIVLGYIVNVIAIIILFIIAFNKKGNKILLNLAIKLGTKFKIIKDKQKFLDNQAENINNFHNGAKLLMKSKWHFIKIIMLNFVALCVLYSIPFTLIIGLHETINPLLVIVTSAYVMLIGSFIPLPGGSGGIEYGFVSFFGFFIIGAKLSSIMIVWRLITYYLGMIVGAITINLYKEGKHENRNVY